MDRLKRRIRRKDTEKKKDKAFKQVEKGRKDLMQELNQQDKEKKKKVVGVGLIHTISTTQNS